MAGIRHTTPADGSFTTEGASAWNGDEAHTLSDVASQTDLDTLSNAVSVADAALSARITSVAGLGSGSVTSAEVNAVSVAAQSAINTVSNALSVLSQTNSSEHAALSSRITSVAGLGAGSVTSAEVNAVSVAAQSAINTVSNAVSVVSNALSVETAARIAADNTISNALSVLSNANSASHVSIDGRVTSVANAVSVLSQALSVLSNTNSAAHVSIDGRVTSVANAISVVSNALSVLSQTNSVDHAALSNRITSVAGLGGGSVTSAEVFNAISSLADRVSANSGTGGGGSVTSAEVNAVSVAAQSAINTVSNALSVLSQTNSVDHAALSARITSVAGLGGGGSVTSAEVNAVSAGYVAADNVLSLRIDSAVTANANNASVASNAASVALAAQHVASNYASVTSNYASVVSNYASVVSNYASVVSATALLMQVPQVRIVSNTQSTAGSALVDISGLVLTVAADQTWEVEGILMFSTSAATVGLKVGTSVPVLSLPRFIEFTRLSAGQSAGIIGGGGLMQISGASQQLSAANAGGVLFGVRYAGVFNVASAGTFRLMYGGTASTAASPVHIMAGSYLKAIRLK